MIATEPMPASADRGCSYERRPDFPELSHGDVRLRVDAQVAVLESADEDDPETGPDRSLSHACAATIQISP